LNLTKKDFQFLLYGAFASFGTYFCMYAFRKPFTVATYENLSFWNIDYKIILIITQVLGYMLSKFLGIKLISELKPNKRIYYLLGMIVFAEVCLILFALTPLPYNFLFMFLNGLALGMVWGVVFSYLEGRKFTELLGVALCSSFILSSGAVKSIGLLVIDSWHVSQFWMPAVTGAIFIIPFTFFALLLNKMPKPTAEDKLLRAERKPMTSKDRKEVFQKFFFPIVILVIFYVFLTALRDFRDNFSREIWDAIGFEGNTSVYTVSEIPIAVLVLLIIGSLGFVKNNLKAFISYHYLLIFGTISIGISTLLFQMRITSPMFWMISSGFGLYVCYVPFNCIFFDRMIATFRIKGNAGYLIYIADAFGYLGSMAVLLYKNFGQNTISWLHFFVKGTYFISIIGTIISVVSLIYFTKKHKKESSYVQSEIYAI
jgi:MFS family permease